MQISSSPTGRVWKRERGTKVASSGCDGGKHEPSRIPTHYSNPHSDGGHQASAAAVTHCRLSTVANFTV